MDWKRLMKSALLMAFALFLIAAVAMFLLEHISVFVALAALSGVAYGSFVMYKDSLEE